MYLKLQRFSIKNNYSFLINKFLRQYSVPATNTAVTEIPQYPPILDEGWEAKLKRKNQAEHEHIKSLKTVEEKSIALNLPRYYGFRCVNINENFIPYNCLPTIQYCTRTHVVDNNYSLPSYYDNIISTEELNTLVESIKNQIQDNIYFEYHVRRRKHEIKDLLTIEYPALQQKQIETSLSRSVACQVNRTLLANLSSKFPHLLSSQLDFEPRREAFWYVGGLELAPRVIKIRKKAPKKDEAYVYANIDKALRYKAFPTLQLRHQFPLKEIISLEESENPDYNVPDCTLDPVKFGFHMDRKHALNIPGFWPGDSCGFGTLAYHNRDALLERPKTFDDTQEALTAQAILGSYSWLYTQACFRGFSTYNDVTYPTTTQTIITNGQLWSFFVYQLNTTIFHSNPKENPRRNTCWGTEQMKLFEEIEDGQIRGLNDEVIKCLIKFYINAPEERTNVEMEPYLGDSVKYVADITDEEEERRIWLETRYKHLMAQRPRHRLAPEILDWQSIYMKKFKTRPMEKKREPWEFGRYPLEQRRLNDHIPPYVPKCFRGNPTKRKMIGKWAKMYYPVMQEPKEKY